MIYYVQSIGLDNATKENTNFLIVTMSYVHVYIHT